MSKDTLNRLCDKRLKANDFAQAPRNYTPISKFEIALIAICIVIAVILFCLQLYKAYF
ncbi:hypothetical protein ABEF79_05930 [Acinetobacter sp. ANC 7454]|uniref:hypothetical protein n=1 Tax=Acinetobacter thermotolerans TaxID=3151487 RepID=UPI00325B0F8A